MKKLQLPEYKMEGVFILAMHHNAYPDRLISLMRTKYYSDPTIIWLAPLFLFLILIAHLRVDTGMSRRMHSCPVVSH